MKRMKKTEQEFEKNSLILFVLMMSANVCNYLFQIVMGNLMEVEQYAQANTVVSLVGVLSIPTTIITMISARYIALNASNGRYDRIRDVIRLMLKFASCIGLVLAIVILILLNKITILFALDSRYDVIGALAITVVNLCYSITSGTLQGMKHFFQYGMQSIMIAAGKLIFSIGLVLLGWKVYGIITALLLGTGIAIVYGVHYMKKYILHRDEESTRHGIDLKEFLRYSFGTIVAQGCVIALTNGDILLVKAYFDDTQAGLYSSASVIGKIAMYVSTAIVATLFPMVVEKHQKGESTEKLFWKAMLYGGGMAVICAVSMVLFGKLVISLLFGERYMQAIHILPAVCVYVVALTFITIMMNYLLAIDRVKVFGTVMVTALAAVIVLSVWFHESVVQLMTMTGCVLLVAFVVNFLYLQYIRYNSKKKKEEKKV